MDFFFVDDAGQSKPSRKGIGSLLAVGGIHIPEEVLKILESEIEYICVEAGFPLGEVFKWSPGRELWMHDNLKFDDRERFFLSVLAKLEEFKITAWVIIEDIKYKTATGTDRHDIDLTQMFLERIHFTLCAKNCNAVVIISQPSGDITAQNGFLTECTNVLKTGSTYTNFERIAQIFSLNHRFSRLLQAADLITSCSTSFVSGENTYSPPVFEGIKPLLGKERDRIGGVGLKLHPDNVYVNLYHWLLGDKMLYRKDYGLGLPLGNFQYSESPNEP